MTNSFATLKTTIAYKMAVTGLVLSAMNHIVEWPGVCPKGIEPKDIIGTYISSPRLDSVPGCPSVVNFETTQFTFIFRDGKLHGVVNTQTNIESVEHHREWAHIPSLINSNDAYHLATNWLSHVFVDVNALNRKYKMHVGQPQFWATPPAVWGEQGSNLTTLPLYYVTWDKGDYQAAKVGIFGPTKQFTGLTIEDPTLTDHTYICVTNKLELLRMTNFPLRLIEKNGDLLNQIVPHTPSPTNDTR
ncbi:MAG TPA: hypothetical protein VGO67_04080 [Verrucomicrobiae bacterium]|jgi:hypothetical protein